MKHRIAWIYSALILVLLTGCNPQEDTRNATTTVERAAQYYPISLGSNLVQLQLALSPAEQSKGLMFRDTMDHDHGMCFLFKTADQRNFWMKNTRLPLDIGYFDSSGRLLEVYALYPHDETSVRSRSRDILIAVEMNQGWYAKNGVAAGDRLDLKALAQALQLRGYSPEDYPLEDHSSD